MADSTENAAPPQSTKSRNSHFPVQIQIKSKSRLEFVVRDTEESEFLNLVDFGGEVFSMESVMYMSGPWYIRVGCVTRTNWSYLT